MINYPELKVFPPSHYINIPLDTSYLDKTYIFYTNQRELWNTSAKASPQLKSIRNHVYMQETAKSGMHKQPLTHFWLFRFYDMNTWIMNHQIPARKIVDELQLKHHMRHQHTYTQSERYNTKVVNNNKTILTASSISSESPGLLCSAAAGNGFVWGKWRTTFATCAESWTFCFYKSTMKWHHLLFLRIHHTIICIRE